MARINPSQNPAKMQTPPTGGHTFVPGYVIEFDDDGKTDLVVDQYPLIPLTSFEDAMDQMIGDGEILGTGRYFLYELISINNVLYPHGQLFHVTFDPNGDWQITAGVGAQQSPRLTRWPPKA